MKFRSMTVGVAVGALLMMSGVAAWAQADNQTSPGQQKRALTPPPVTAPTDAARSATESAVRNARDDAYRRAKARREHLAALKRKRHAMRKAR